MIIKVKYNSGITLVRSSYTDFIRIADENCGHDEEYRFTNHTYYRNDTDDVILETVKMKPTHINYTWIY